LNTTGYQFRVAGRRLAGATR